MEIVKDPVCGMVFVKEDAAGKTLLDGKTYYFCAPSCKKSFDFDPQKYLASARGLYGSTPDSSIIFGEDERDEEDNSLREHD